MITLTRLDGREFVVNIDQVVFVEATPDTRLTLRGGDRLMVREEVAEVVRRVVEFRRQLGPVVPKE
jgi:flagellar protein FlbD